MNIRVHSKILSVLAYSTSMSREVDHGLEFLINGELAGGLYPPISKLSDEEKKKVDFPKSLSVNAYKLAIIILSKFADSVSWKDDEYGETAFLTLYCDEWCGITGISPQIGWRSLTQAAIELSYFGFIRSYIIPQETECKISPFVGGITLPRRKSPLRLAILRIIADELIKSPAIRIPPQLLKTSGKCPSAIRLAVGLGIRWTNRLTHKNYQYQTKEWAQMTFKYALEVAGIRNDDEHAMRALFRALRACEVTYFFSHKGLVLNDKELSKMGINRALSEARLVFQIKE